MTSFYDPGSECHGFGLWLPLLVHWAPSCQPLSPLHNTAIRCLAGLGQGPGGMGRAQTPLHPWEGKGL
jgi:hypothetical protein